MAVNARRPQAIAMLLYPSYCPPAGADKKKSPERKNCLARNHGGWSRNPYLPTPLVTFKLPLSSFFPAVPARQGLAVKVRQGASIQCFLCPHNSVTKWWEQKSSSMVSLSKTQQTCLGGEHDPDTKEGRTPYFPCSRPGHRCAPWVTFVSYTSDVRTGLSLNYGDWNMRGWSGGLHVACEFEIPTTETLEFHFAFQSL